MNAMRFIQIILIIVLFQGMLYCSEIKENWAPKKTSENIQKLDKFLKGNYQEAYNNMRKFYSRYYDRILREIDKKSVFVDYIMDLSPALEGVKKGVFFCNIFKRHIEPFFNNIIIPEDEEIKKDFQSFLAHIAALAQDSPKCWISLLNKVENMVASLPAKEAQNRVERLRAYIASIASFFRKKIEKVSNEDEKATKKRIEYLLDVLGNSAVRAYAYAQSKNEKFTDFYILAVLNTYKNYSQSGYEDFKKLIINKLNSYLEQLRVADDEIDKITKEISKKAEYSYVRRNWKYMLGGVVALGAAAGLGYWLYKTYQNRSQVPQDIYEAAKSKFERTRARGQQTPWVLQSKENFERYQVVHEDLINNQVLPNKIQYAKSIMKDFSSKELVVHRSLESYNDTIQDMKESIDDLENFWKEDVSSGETMTKINNTIDTMKEALSKVESAKEMAYPSQK